MPSKSEESTIPSTLVMVLQLYGLNALALTYPLLSILGANPTYFVVNDTPAQVLYFVAIGVALVIPTALAVLPIVLRGETRWAVQIVLVAVFVTVAFSPLTARLSFFPGEVNLILAVALAGLTVREFMSNRVVQWGVALLFPLAVFFPWHFLAQDEMRAVLASSQFENPVAPAESIEQKPPIVFVIFDELPLVSLLDAEGDIDGRRFPNFARLADDATWYSNATTVHDFTTRAIPAILTGMYPVDDGLLPIEEHHPANLFSLLEGHYDFHVHEEATALFRDGGSDPAHFEWGGFVSDSAVLFAHAVLPKDVAVNFGRIDKNQWAGFRDGEMSESERDEQLKERFRNERASRKRWGYPDDPGQVVGYETYLDEMAEYSRKTLHFVHLIAPHQPYVRLPSGRFMGKGRIEHLGRKGIHHKHLLQVGYVDRLLGNLLVRLEELELYDESLVVVLSDHGVGVGGERRLTRENFGDIGFVPLMIKMPGQREGARDESNVQTIDVVPTIEDVVGVLSGRKYDGRSLVDVDAMVPPLKRLMNSEEEILEFGGVEYLDARQTVFERNVRRFHLDAPTASLFQISAGGELIGRAIEDVGGVTIGAVNEWEIDYFKPEQRTISNLIWATVDPPFPDNGIVAIALNGTVVATTELDPTEMPNRWYYFLMNDELLQAGRKNRVEARLVSLPPK